MSLPSRPLRALVLALLLAPVAARALPQEPPPPTPEASPAAPAPEAPAPEAPAPEAPPVPDAPAAEPQVQLAPAPPEPPPAPPAEPSYSRDEWADSGFGFNLSSLGTERFQGRFYEVGVFGGLGGPLAVKGLQSGVALGGVHIFENRGYVTKFTIGMLVALAAAAAGNQVHVGSKTEQYGGYTVRTDYYRTLTPDEQARRNALAGEAFDEDYAVELSVYAPRMPTVSALSGRETASGFELYIGGPVVPEGSLPIIFQYGFGASYIGVKGAEFLAGQGPNGQLAENLDRVHREEFHYANAGAMLRLTVPVTAFAELRAQWDINALQIFKYGGERDKRVQEGRYYTSPFRLGAVINVSDRFYGSVTGTLNGLGLYGLGGAAELGVRL